MPALDPEFAAFLADFEGLEVNSQYDDNDTVDNENDDRETAQFLMDAAFLHAISPCDEVIAEEPIVPIPTSQFTIEGRYSRLRFQGIIPDTGAAEVSTASYEQYLALKREDPSVQMDTSRAGEALVKFGKGSRSLSIGAIAMDTLIGEITFHVVDAPTLFLLCV